jgi:hypothetical protein
MKSYQKVDSSPGRLARSHYGSDFTVRSSRFCSAAGSALKESSPVNFST